MRRNKLRTGTSGDAILLTGVKLITTAIGLLVTRLLSQYLPVSDYGTYSQAMLIVSTVNTITILGMADGVNFFHCSEKDPQKREAYLATTFMLQCAVSSVAGGIVLLLSQQICYHFENPQLKNLLIFSASLPLVINVVSMLQVLVVSVGKAKMLAVRNLAVSVIRLIVVLLVIAVVKNVAIVMLTTLLMDVGQIIWFAAVLKKHGCHIRLKAVDVRLIKRIIYYCAPMGVFTAISALNRDMDKYLIALMEDTETLALYSNASKVLPFDIIMTSFCTVLIPQITRLVAREEKEEAARLYRMFLEIACITTAILCCAALMASPQLMKLLYSNVYTGGLAIFRVYILVDLLRFTNITIVLSAAGKTTKLMLYSVGSVALNTVTNILFYRWMGITGPAVATFLTTLILGICILGSSAREVGTTLVKLFDSRYFLLFAAENLAAAALLIPVRKWLETLEIHYFWILAIVCGLYGSILMACNWKRLFKDMKYVNNATKRPLDGGKG